MVYVFDTHSFSSDLFGFSLQETGCHIRASSLSLYMKYQWHNENIYKNHFYHKDLLKI
jgi:hypothetical protein